MSRLSPGTLIIAIFAILFGLAGAYAAKRFLEPREAVVPAVAAASVARVPLAAANLPAGRPLQHADVYLATLPVAEIEARGIPQDAITNPTMLLGRVLREPLERGDPFTAEALYPEGMGPGVAERLPHGYRAVTIPIEDDGAVAGFATPGSMVDVLFRSESNDGRNIHETTVTLIEGAEVLAMNDNPVPGAREVGKKDQPVLQKTVTLAVMPREVNILKVVQGRGELSLSMRNPDDERLAGQMAQLTLEQLLDVQPRPQPHVVEVYRGSSRETLTFDKSQAVDERFGGVKRRAARNASNRRSAEPRPADDVAPLNDDGTQADLADGQADVTVNY